MDNEIIYAVVGIIILIGIIIFTLGNSNNNSGSASKSVQIKNPAKTKQGIINRYKKQLKNELALLNDDNKARISKKNELLKKFNGELALNIYFDKSEIREVIMELSKEG